MPLDTGSTNSNVIKLPFTTLMTINVSGIVNFKNPIESEFEIIDLLDWLIAHGVEDISIKDIDGNPVNRYRSLIGQSSFILGPEAISLCAQALENIYPTVRRTIDATQKNIYVVMPT